MTPIRAVIVHRDQPERCAETVRLLGEQGVPLDVVIVDNDSRPAATATLRALEDVRVLDAGFNAGFGGGANVALREWLADPAAGEWVLVMPHDARPEPGCLQRLLDAVEGLDDVGLVSAEYGDDELPAVDKVFGAVTVTASRSTGFSDAGYAHGTFLLLRRPCLDDIGVFDESYFAYCEEADLALRARHAGWRAGVVWGAVVTNPHQSTATAAIDYLMVRNTVYLVRRHFGSYNASLRFLIALVSTPWYVIRRGRRSPWFDARGRVFAMRDILLRRGGPPPEILVDAVR